MKKAAFMQRAAFFIYISAGLHEDAEKRGMPDTS
jgi:hypothetical protein